MFICLVENTGSTRVLGAHFHAIRSTKNLPQYESSPCAVVVLSQRRSVEGMIIFPGHHSQKTKTANFTPSEEQASNSTNAKSFDRGTNKNEDLEHAHGKNRPADETPSPNPIHQERFKTAATRGGSSAIPDEFDEYGTELGPDARVWRTYVTEADKFDSEKAEEWNKSLDVILIFAALFSAISTAFVMESSKKLQPDPAEMSAQTLTMISQTLLLIVNNSQPLVHVDSAHATSEKFKPGYLAVCVNILWFLSLSLSVAVSLLAMLAKEWCHRFMSSRTGGMCSQAKRRQQRWEGLEKWKMEEVLMFLPSLIHLALFLFAIGLCIYLWEMHFGVAMPVAIVTFLTFGVYTASTLLPLFYQHCPYNTTASRFITSIFNILAKKSGESNKSFLEQDLTTTKALCWLIDKCEDPRSIDVALQAIAGADGNLPLDPLRECHADIMICQRLTAGSSYPTTYETVFGLYARAFAVLHPPADDKDQIEEKGGYDHANELKRKIRTLQVVAERVVVDLLAIEKFVPTQDNLTALRFGSTAPTYCLQSLGFGTHDRLLTSLESAIGLLGKHMNHQSLLHPSSIQSLVLSIAMLLACSSLHRDQPLVTTCVVRLLRYLDQPGTSRRFTSTTTNQSEEYIGFLLAVFTISQEDYPGWTHPAPLGRVGRAERAIEVIIHYAPDLGKLTRGFFPQAITRSFGVQGLLLLPGLTDDDYGVLYEKLDVDSGRFTSDIIHTLPPGYDVIIASVILALNQRILDSSKYYDNVFLNGPLVKAHLIALHKAHSGPAKNIPPFIYIFALESTCRLLLEAPTPDQNNSIFTSLMERLPAPSLSTELVSIIIERNIPSILEELLRSGSTILEIFAIKQFVLFAEIFLPARSEGKLHKCEISDLLLSCLFGCEESCNPLRRIELVNTVLRERLKELKPVVKELRRARERAARYWNPPARSRAPSRSTLSSREPICTGSRSRAPSRVRSRRSSMVAPSRGASE